MDWELKERAEKLQSDEETVIFRKTGSLIYYIPVIAMLLIFWLLGNLIGSHPWGNVEWALALATVWLVPAYCRWSSIRSKEKAVRDQRIIRIEMRIEEMANSLEALKHSLDKCTSESSPPVATPPKAWG